MGQSPRHLQGLLQPPKSSRVEAIYQWEPKLKTYEQQSGDKMKIAVLGANLVDASPQK